MSAKANLKMQSEVVLRFRKKAFKLAPNQSEALTVLLDFWEEKHKENDASKPEINQSEKIIPHVDKAANRIISIIKNIEKDKIDRIHGMMNMLFGLGSAQEKLSKPSAPKAATKNDPFDPQYKAVFDKIDLQHKKKTLEWEVKEVKKAFHQFLDQKITVQHPRIGKPYLKLHLEPNELLMLKQQYKTD